MKPTLWILDAPTELRTIAAYIAETWDFEVTVLGTLAEAREKLGSSCPDFVISALWLGDGETRPWLQDLRRRSPATRIVCWDGEPRPDQVYRLLDLGIHCFPRPGSLVEILEFFKRAWPG